MFDFGYVVLVVFIIARVLIAVGLFYLVLYEVRKAKGSRPKKRKGTKEDANGEGSDSSSEGRS